jgi:hypothetical protein
MSSTGCVGADGNTPTDPVVPSGARTIWWVSEVPLGQLPPPPAPAALQTDIDAMAGGCGPWATAATLQKAIEQARAQMDRIKVRYLGTGLGTVCMSTCGTSCKTYGAGIRGSVLCVLEDRVGD